MLIRAKWREFLKLKEQQQKQTEREQANTGSEAAAVETVVSRKRVYDHNEGNDDQPSAAVVAAPAAESETSKAGCATAELESTRRTSSKTIAEKYSETDEAAANPTSLSETFVNPATSSSMRKANGAQKRAAVESIEKAAATVTTKTKILKSTISSTDTTPKRGPVTGRAQVKPVNKPKMKNSAEPDQVEVRKTFCDS